MKILHLGDVMIKWVECTRERNGVIIKKWREPYFIHKIKWFYKLYIRGYRKYYKKIKGDINR